jgi:hypothetical protein
MFLMQGITVIFSFKIELQLNGPGFFFELNGPGLNAFIRWNSSDFNLRIFYQTKIN